ncbi:MAG: HAD family hydrolase [Actinomycetota bacterium]
MILTCRALLFDMDGVLIDSTAHVDRVWRRWAQEREVDPETVLAIAHGRRTVEVLETVAPHLATSQEVALLEARDGQDLAGIGPVPGAASLLEALPSGRCAVVTSATAPLARTRFGHAGLPDPEVLVSADDVTQGKPAPDGYLAAAALLGFEPRDCVVFEDAPPGITAGNAAGMRVVGVATTYDGEDLGGAHAVVRDLSNVSIEVVEDKLRVELTEAL